MESNRKQTSFRCDIKLLKDFQSKLIDAGKGMKGMSPMIEGWIRDYVSGQRSREEKEEYNGGTEKQGQLPADVLAAVEDALTVLPVSRVSGFLRDLADATREAIIETYNTGKPREIVARARRIAKGSRKAGKKDLPVRGHEA